MEIMILSFGCPKKFGFQSQLLFSTLNSSSYINVQYSMTLGIMEILET